MNSLTGIIIFILGLVIGSFLNVVIYRLKELETIVVTRSHCPHCKKNIAWYDLIPFLSFIILKTSCRNCGKPISWQYPLVEIGTALLFIALYWHFGLSVSLFFSLLVSMFLIVIFVYDLLHYIIPEEIIWPAIIITVIYVVYASVAKGDWQIFWQSLLGALIAGGFLMLLVLLGRGKWMGIGDIKLGILAGLLAGWPQVVLALFASFILGSLVGMGLIAYRKKTMKDMIPFGPFLVLGIYISIFFGKQIMGWYLGFV